MPSLTADAPAKLNLTLRVLRRRDDGYHELDSIVARIVLADTLTATPRDDARLTLSCSDPDLPTDGRNLVLKAADALRKHASTSRGAHLDLVKRIPPGAGLGGGSSDAAATLRLLDQLWGLGRSAQDLSLLAATVGSDVPLFLAAPVARLRGRGDIVEDLRLRLRGHVVLVLPPILAATPDVFRAWQPPAHPHGDANPERLLAGRWSQVMPRLFNDLEPAARSILPALDALAGRLRIEVDPRFCMSGSGSAFFIVCDEAAEARRLAALAASRLGVRTEVTEFRA